MYGTKSLKLESEEEEKIVQKRYIIIINILVDGCTSMFDAEKRREIAKDSQCHN